jgi:putative CocE/NonD family hydrolase
MKISGLRYLLVFVLLIACGFVKAQEKTTAQDSIFTLQDYIKIERRIPMRDGTKLFTSIYIPKDTSQKYPLLICRTPYSVAPYGENNFRIPAGPNRLFDKEKFIFVYQDVRGRYLSEGKFIANRPYIPNKKSNKDVDESSDTYDTIDWLIENVPGNNGKAGIWGISSPGFYATSSLIESHPALKAVSPQAPVTDWFMGDDRHHNGAFMLMGSFSFLSSFGKERDSISTVGASGFYNYNSKDAYRFYLDAGPLKNFNDKFLHSKSILWNEMMEHPNYDHYWKIRNPVPHLQDVKPAVLTVGGWFDQEDPYGPLKVFEGLEKAKPSNENILVMGPWYHGQWSRKDGDVLGDINFGSKTGVTYRNEIELPFFLFYLKDAPDPKLPKACIFETGSNQWKKYDKWPPESALEKNLYLRDNGLLSFTAPEIKKPAFAEYISDPSKPVPYSAERTIFRGYKYMVEDQRFAFTRPDVITFETEALQEDVTIAGHLTADLFVSSTGTDADFIVKLIDEAPQDGYQLMVRGEVMRAKFRKSFSNPIPLVPNKITEVKFDMQDAAHCFLKGHKIMIQIQSSWFPLVDRNPQTFTNIYTADESAFQKATNRVYFNKDAASHIKLQVIPTHKTQ